MSLDIGKALIEFEKILQHPFEADGMTFFIGLVVLDFIFKGFLYWDSGPSQCKIASTKVCKKSIVVFRNITETFLYVFAVVLGVKIVGSGIRRHKGCGVKAFLPIASFSIFISLFIWLFLDITAFMMDTPLAPHEGGGELIRKEFYYVLQQFDYWNNDSFPYVLLGGLVYGLV